MNTRLLGIVCIVGSVIKMLDAVRGIVVGLDGFDTGTRITIMLWYICAIAALVAMIRLNAVGSRIMAKALAFLPIIGFVVLILAGFIGLAGAVTLDNGVVAGIGWLVQMAGMVLVGILTIAAKHWRGWRRFVPLLTGVLMPLSFGIGIALSINLGATFVYAAWVLLGYVIATAEPAPALQPSVAA